MNIISEAAALELIKIVRQFECIYNTKHDDYNKTKRNIAWRQIADLSHMNVEKCKNAWRILRTQHTNRLRRQVQRGCTHSDHIFDAALAFLKPHMAVGHMKRKKLQHEQQQTTVSNEHDEHEDSQSDLEIPTAALQAQTMQEPWNDTDIYFYRISQIVKTFSKHEQARVKMHLYEMLHSVELKEIELKQTV